MTRKLGLTNVIFVHGGAFLSLIWQCWILGWTSTHPQVAFAQFYRKNFNDRANIICIVSIWCTLLFHNIIWFFTPVYDFAKKFLSITGKVSKDSCVIFQCFLSLDLKFPAYISIWKFHLFVGVILIDFPIAFLTFSFSSIGCSSSLSCSVIAFSSEPLPQDSLKLIHFVGVFGWVLNFSWVFLVFSIYLVLGTRELSFTRLSLFNLIFFHYKGFILLLILWALHQIICYPHTVFSKFLIVFLWLLHYGLLLDFCQLRHSISGTFSKVLADTSSICL